MLESVKYILPVLLTVISGCEQVIDLDLNDAGSALVIEAGLSSPKGVLTVTVSKTGSYFTPDSVEKVDNASVYLENSKGIQKAANAVGNGTYELDRILADPGDKFKLMVEVDGVQYNAESTVMPPVEIDSISYSYYDGDSFFRSGYRFNISLSDPPGVKNYYRIKAYSNTYFHNRPHDLVVFNDADLDGKVITAKLQSQYFIDAGETLIFELLSIDRQAWEYFTTFADLIHAGTGSPSPANPVSSFTNGAQGYFYAWSYSRKSVTVEE